MRSLFAFALLGGSLIAACSSSAESLNDPGSGTGGGQDASTGTGGSAQGGASGQGGQPQGGSSGAAGEGGSISDAGPEAAGPDPFDGTWGLLLVMTSAMDAPVIGPSESENRMIARVEQTRVGDTLTVKFHTCDFDIKSSNQGVQIIVPDAFVAALPDETLTGTLKDDGSQFQLVVPKLMQLRSVKLDNPETDPLPTDPNDPRVLDWDNDSHPGMTISVTGSVGSGDMYIIQRTWTELKGSSYVTESIDGTITWDVDQVLLDATNPLMKMMPDPTATTDPAKNYFRHRKIDPALTCADIITQQDTLFAP